ncbi:class I SAM-dependent methyltransferase [Cyclobacterium jeungdonense]|uniref:Class I SAM-dependent methyltransferase n=1 Tax=Cyclobacterium jeungdonense TaxID=708087 RepID=A0ABT8C588_9BACT|nr:class I SAM-dependent methyltransferase [Cyclobacterium jeungdonense]MDN3687896.1 class I SAM-dependent methyltransferase [Cyclobacterium jeungdonense]
MRKEPLRDHYLLLAPFYEFISKKVIGSDFQQSKRTFLDQIQKGDTVLVLGGGTGTILPLIMEQIGESGRVIYLEASGTMIQRSRQQVDLPFSRQVQWIHSSRFEDLPLIKPDVIISHYFLDVLPDESIDRLFQEIEGRIHSQTDWIFADFFPTANRKGLLWGMITLFRLFTRHPRKDLPDYLSFFRKWGWEKVDFVPFQQGFFQAIRYRPAPRSINSPITSLK